MMIKRKRKRDGWGIEKCRRWGEDNSAAPVFSGEMEVSCVSSLVGGGVD